MADEYIRKSDVKKAMHSKYADDMRKYPELIAWLKSAVDIVISEIPTADVQPLSVVAEHIKKRLYETAFDTNELIAREAITDMAERIDFWIDELKEGEHND